jgi:hypothetical protein
VRGGEALDGRGGDWWQSPWCAAILVLLAAVPLLYPPVPPLLDLPGHIGRYRIELEYDQWPAFRDHFRFEWALIGNLGIDLLVVPLEPVFGLERSVKLILLAVPPLTVAGFLLTAREAHGRIPPTALFALPLAYNFPFHFGFVNFSLAMALAFLALPLWMRLGRLGRLRLRAALFVPLSLLLWVTHAFGWAILLALAFAAEFTGDGGAARNWRAPAWRAGLRCLPLMPPVLAMLAWRLAGASAGSVTGGGYNPVTKLAYLLTPLRDRWQWFDLASLAVLAALIGVAVKSRRFEFSPPLAWGAAILVPCYLLAPARLFDASYVDMRLLPFLFAVALLAVRPSASASPGLVRVLALAGLAFFLARMGGNAASLYLYSREFDRELAAVEHIAPGSRVVALVAVPCRAQWTMRRLDHLPGLAIARRRAFANDQWSSPGAQLVRPNYPAAGGFQAAPSQQVRITGCPGTKGWPTLDESLRQVPRAAFDYLWLVRPPTHDPALLAGLRPVWRNGDSVLYRIDHPATPAGKN